MINYNKSKLRMYLINNKSFIIKVNNKINRDKDELSIKEESKKI